MFNNFIDMGNVRYFSINSFYMAFLYGIVWIFFGWLSLKVTRKFNIILFGFVWISFCLISMIILSLYSTWINKIYIFNSDDNVVRYLIYFWCIIVYGSYYYSQTLNFEYFQVNRTLFFKSVFMKVIALSFCQTMLYTVVMVILYVIFLFVGLFEDEIINIELNTFKITFYGIYVLNCLRVLSNKIWNRFMTENIDNDDMSNSYNNILKK